MQATISVPSKPRLASIEMQVRDTFLFFKPTQAFISFLQGFQNIDFQFRNALLLFQLPFFVLSVKCHVALFFTFQFLLEPMCIF